MRAGLLAVFSGVCLAVAAGCSTSPRASLSPVIDVQTDEQRAAWARSAYETNRQIAFAKRRFKALFKGDVSPEFGAILRGYLLVWWDGETLTWKTSAPLAGTVGKGILTRGTDPNGLSTRGDAHVPFPGALTERDAIGVLLGVLDLPAAGRPVSVAKSGALVRLDDSGRSALLDGSGRIVRLELGPDASVDLEPGDGVPRRIAAHGKQGRAQLSLESFGPWPLDEPIP